MPSLKIFRNVSIRPLAGDDIHWICNLLGLYRVIILVFAAALAGRTYLRKASNDHIMCSGAGSGDPYSRDGKRRHLMVNVYIVVLMVLVIGDLALIACIYSAASIGTPTQTRQRDKYLRPLLQLKLFGMNTMLLLIVVWQLMFIYINRDDNYGCPADDKVEYSVWYSLFVTILFLFAIELMLIPATIAGKISLHIQRLDPLKDREMTTAHRQYCWEACLGGCLKCCGLFCCCNKAGGREISVNKGHLKDTIEVLLDFFRHQGMLDVVFSDIYVALKALARDQRERQVKCINQAIRAMQLHTSLEEGFVGNPSFFSVGVEAPIHVGAISLFVGDMPFNDEDTSPYENLGTEVQLNNQGGVKIIDRTMDLKRSASPGSVWKIKRKEEGKYELRLRNLMSPANEHDEHILKEAIPFARYAHAIYDNINDALRVHILGTSQNMFQAFFGLEEEFYLSSIGYDRTILIYASFQNGIAETPYCILVDHDIKTVAVVIRGTASLDDMIIDLQLAPASVAVIGEKCGFCGVGEFCHRGVLTRSEWIYDDITRNGLLQKLLLVEDPLCPGYKLVMTGHSLGAGCATLLSIMSREKYPSLRCFAFCPPGGLLSEGLANECKSYVTSVVNDTDVIPRTSLPNLVKMQDDSMELLTRIKVPKIQAYYNLKAPCNDQHLEAQNAKLLCSKEEIPMTEFFCQVQKFRAQRRSDLASRNAPVRLYPPGNIIHLVKTSSVVGESPTKIEYLPQWADKDDFNEILLSPTLLEDHSIKKVIANLERICNSFKKTIEERRLEDEIVEIVFEPELDHVIHDDFVPTLICCSKPHGQCPLFTALIGTLASLLGVASNNYCALMTLSTISASGDTSSGVLSVGLYNVRALDYIGSDNSTNFDKSMDLIYCSVYPPEMVLDSYIASARICSLLGSIIGAGAVVALWLTACMRYRQCTWHFITVALMCATILQGLVFLIFRTSFCSVVYFEGNDESDAIMDTETKCTLGRLGYAAIVTIVLWFLCTVLTLRYPPIIYDYTRSEMNLDHMANLAISNTDGFTDVREEEQEEEEQKTGEGSFIEHGDLYESVHDTFIPRMLTCVCFLGYTVCCRMLCFVGFGVFLCGLILLGKFVMNKPV